MTRLLTPMPGWPKWLDAARTAALAATPQVAKWALFRTGMRAGRAGWASAGREAAAVTAMSPTKVANSADRTPNLA
jgi:hypothetical protein